MKVRGYFEFKVKHKLVRSALGIMVQFWRRRGVEEVKIGPFHLQFEALSSNLARTGPMAFGLDTPGLFLRRDVVDTLYRNLTGFFVPGSMRPSASAFRRLRDFAALLERVVLLGEEGQLMRPYGEVLLRSSEVVDVKGRDPSTLPVEASVREWSNGHRGFRG